MLILSRNIRLMMLFSVLVNDEQGQQNISSGHKSAAQHNPGSQQSSPNQSGVIIMVCLIGS